MKQILFLLCVFCSLSVNAQRETQTTYFDPEKDPVAMLKDSSIQLVVSEVLLRKSLKTSMDTDFKVVKIITGESADGTQMLIFEGELTSKNRLPYTIGIPLLPDIQNRYFYAATQALVCSAPGCNNCTISNNTCVGCCSSASESRSTLNKPLVKVQITSDK